MSPGTAALVRIDPDLDAVTTIGDEAEPGAAGVTRADIDAIWQSVQEWYRLGTTPAIQVCLRRRGHVVMNRAIGYGWGNAPKDGPDAPKQLVTPESPFCGFSTAKGVSTALMFMLIEQGAFALTDPVCAYIPEFSSHGKDRITLGDVLSHSAGVPFITPPHRGADLVLDEELAVRGLVDLVPSWPPGRFRVYHALTGGLIQRLLVRRATGKSMREHLREQVLDPLGFRWNNFGVRPEDVDAVVPSVKVGPGPSPIWRHVAGRALGGGLSGPTDATAVRAFLTAELPSGNLVTTAFELSRFYEILTRGGELDGVRIMGPETLAAATRPAPWLPGIAGRVSVGGYELGARRSKFGRHTESHFGRSGLTTQYGWSDRARSLSGAILTSGKAQADTARPARLVAQISELMR
ncbi:class A beta-lactamase-related serine hydrolase [Nocardia yunnanensis]|uniref:Class A beta-lactamase-related serine hydrolase n=1 Tax=Nocardia yunnanensis TaxID=2382165 RepID=A0A386ZMC9_9NOCA|nr:serine hydrolase domain-containing protein [Nocardia yunnanensis]AYF78483.1 class A beta-lactamase-related serine hydrolase [Nocardia yunnanensis]